MLKKTLEDGTSNVRFSRIFSEAKPKPEHTGAGTKGHGDSIEQLYRSDRKSARPIFSQDDNDVPPKKKEVKQHYQL